MALTIKQKEPYNITEFAPELLEHIFKYCSWQDLPAIVRSCRKFNELLVHIISNLTRTSIQRLSMLYLPDNVSEIDSLCQKMGRMSLENKDSPHDFLKILISKVTEKKLGLLDSKEDSLTFLKNLEDTIKENKIPFSFVHKRVKGGNITHIEKTIELFSYRSAFYLIRNIKNSGESYQLLLSYLCNKYLNRYEVYKKPSDINAAQYLTSLISENPKVQTVLSERIKLLKEKFSPQ